MPFNLHETSKIFTTYKRVDDKSNRPLINSFSLSDSASECKFKSHKNKKKIQAEKKWLLLVLALNW